MNKNGFHVVWIDTEYTKAKCYFKKTCNIRVTVNMGQKIVQFVNNHCTKPCRWNDDVVLRRWYSH